MVCGPRTSKLKVVRRLKLRSMRENLLEAKAVGLRVPSRLWERKRLRPGLSPRIPLPPPPSPNDASNGFLYEVDDDDEEDGDGDEGVVVSGADGVKARGGGGDEPPPPLLNSPKALRSIV
jgi:hypothetical protein